MKTKFLKFDTACQVDGVNVKFFGYLSLAITMTFAVLANATEPASLLTTDLTTSIGTTLDPKDTQTSVGIEPELTFHVSKKTDIGLYAWIDRPTDAYKNFGVPLITLTPVVAFDSFPGLKTSVSLLIAALEVESWKAEGSSIKVRPGFKVGSEILKGLTLSGRVGPYAVFNRYAQSTDGKDRSRYGLNEKLMLDYELGHFVLQLALAFDQRYTQVWKNDYSTFEQLQYNITDAFGIGVNHSLLGGFIDESTGYYKKLQLFDSRQSRVSAFVEVKF